MDRDWLEAQLAAGRSIESIAREVGKHPSTVAYWVKKHTLHSDHAARHAARGGVKYERLEELVERGLSVRQIAAEVDRSVATVRHWLEHHGLETRRAARRKRAEADAGGGITAECPVHGVTRFGMRGDSGVRCLACRSEAVVARRRRVKAILVAEAGGRCLLCGYDRSPVALQFHHLDRSTKEFHLSREGVTRSLARARAEAAKCVLLCANCHAEVEGGIATIPQAAPVSPG